MLARYERCLVGQHFFFFSECLLNDSSDTSDNACCSSGSEYLPSDGSRHNSPTRFSLLNPQQESEQRELEHPEQEQPEVGQPEPIQLLQDQILDETTGQLRNITPEKNRQENENTKTRKRLRNEGKWARNERKTKRAKGEEYISQKGILVPQKQMTPGSCPCPLKCHEVINMERQVKIFKDFYALGSFDLQSAFLFSSIKVVPKNRSYAGESQKRTNTRLYHLINDAGEEKRVCKLFYLKTLQVSNGRVDRVLKNKGNLSMPPKDRRGKFPPANKIPTEKINEVMEFISKFPSYQSHYSRKKTERKFLSPNLNLRIMFNLYKESVEQPLSESMFRKVFNEKFNLSFHPLVTDSCKKCDGFNVKIAAASSEEDKRQLETERELHQRKADSARKGLQEDTLLAKSDPNVTCITFDLMKTLPTPVLSTGVCYYKRQLWTYCMGIHNVGTDDAYMYLWDETVASRGPQEVGSCLLHYIKTNVRSKRLVMYSDQCGGQNRNIKMAVLCNYIVSSPDFTVTEIHHKFLVSGHSYLPCDQDFGLIEKEKNILQIEYMFLATGKMS